MSLFKLIKKIFYPLAVAIVVSGHIILWLDRKIILNFFNFSLKAAGNNLEKKERDYLKFFIWYITGIGIILLWSYFFSKILKQPFTGFPNIEFLWWIVPFILFASLSGLSLNGLTYYSAHILSALLFLILVFKGYLNYEFSIIGFFILLTIIPFHSWFTSIISGKVSWVALIFMILLPRIAVGVIFPLESFITEPFKADMNFAGAVTFVYGCLAALACQDLKRTLGYLNISSIGLLLLIALQDIQPAYFIFFSIMSASAFILLVLIFYNLNEKGVSQRIEDYSGLMKKFPAFGYIFILSASFFIIYPILSIFITGRLNLLNGSIGIWIITGELLLVFMFGWIFQRIFTGKPGMTQTSLENVNFILSKRIRFIIPFIITVNLLIMLFWKQLLL